MYNSHQISLEEFIIGSIPSCQHGCALETMLNACQSSKNGTIAVVDSQQFPIGIVTAHRLLSLFVKYQHNPRITTLVGSQKDWENRAALMATTNLTSLIEPIKVLSSRVTAAEFITYAKDQCAGQYAIVDSQGKFLGMLDTQKLFEFLLENDKPQSRPPASELSSHLLSLIENIDLPLMVQEGENKILYQNHHWQKHLDRLQEGDLTNYSSHIAQWWSWQQKTPDEVPLLFTELSDAEPVPIENFLSSGFSSSCRESFAASNLQISYLNSWYYVRIPLNLAMRATNTSSIKELWLVLAVEAENEPIAKNVSEEVDWSRLKDECLAYISHELKSPLTGIVGLSNLLKAQKLGTLNQRQVSYAEIIYRSGKRLSNLVNDLLELTRLTNSKQDLFIEPIALETLCRQTYGQILEELETDRHLATNRSVSGQVTADADNKPHDILVYPQLELSVSPDSKTAFADKSSLVRILSCLIKRAIKSQPKSLGITVNSWTGWIAIVVWNQIEVTARSQQPPETLASESNDTTVEDNSDLSLLIARQLAKAHGGDISLVSKARGRNELTLLLPDVAAKQTPESNKSPSNRLLILIIENLSERIARIATEIEDLGYYCVVAHTGIDGLRQARQLKPSYILMNPVSSVLDGRDLLTLLKTNPSTKNIPVFVLSTAKHKLEASKAFRQAQGVICEPFDRATLAEILPVKQYAPAVVPQNITILCIYPEPEVIDETSSAAKNLDFSLKDWSERDWMGSAADEERSSHNTRYRIIEADGLEQADMLARIWQLDAVVLDNVAIREPLAYLRSFQQSSYLASLPTIVLDSQTSAAANQIEGLTVYPCLLPAKSRSIEDLMQVIQIATNTKNSRSQA